MVRTHGSCDVVLSSAGRTRSTVPRACAGAVLLLLAALTPAVPVAASQADGRWLPSSLPDPAYKLHYASFDGLQVATHMAVLRGVADSTVILYWHSPDETFVMTHWDRSYPALPVFSDLNRKNVKPHDDFNTDLFCAGHSSLGTGRLLVTGGTGEGEIGTPKALVFNPTAYQTNNGWEATNPMSHARWYPSQVTLGNGTISYSGMRYWEMMTHGGLLPSGTPSDSLILFGLTAETFWRERYPHRGDPATGTGPTPRTDHTGGWFAPLRAYDADRRGVIAVYGGRTGAPASSAVNELWIAWRTSFDPEESWNWKVAVNATAGTTPPKRYQHSAVVHESWNAQYTAPPPVADSLALFVYGGLDGTGAASDELWLFRAYVDVGTASFRFTTWKVDLSGAGAGPGPRYGHTAIYDPGPSVNSTPTPRMLVYGGRQADGTLADGADNKVWALTLTPPYQWSVVASDVGAPPPRYRHTAIFRGVGGGESDAAFRVARVIVFGGEGSGGTRNDTWVLSRCNNADNCATQFSWTAWSSLTQAPSGRYRHSTMYDVTNERMIVFGGDLSSGSPNLTDQTYALPVTGSTVAAPGGVAWQALNPPYASGGPRAGHIAVYHGWDITSRLPERYDPIAQSWTPLTTALRFDRGTYPFLFRLPSGNVFYAGRNNRTLLPGDGFNNSMNGTAVLNLSGTPSWNEDVASPMGGATAIMYRPGKIIKVGSAGHATRDHTAWTDLTTNESSYTWQHDGLKLAEKRLVPRIHENLTMLPTGDVLATGGYGQDFNPGTARQKVQIWNPGEQEWTPELASDPSTRGYHSVAILLPSGVIMSAGGGQTDKYDYASIYQPPYLFKAGNVLRDSTDRPRIWGSLPLTVSPGQVFTVCMPPNQNVTRVTLLRPGATTHEFNQDQNYVPLSFTKAPSGPSRLFVTAPPNLNQAPAGDHLLFVIDSTAVLLSERVPSVGRWLRMATTRGADLCDAVAPGIITDLTPDVVGPNEIWFMWTGTADDGVLPVSGSEQSFDLRADSAPLDDETAWAGADFTSQDETVPGAPGTFGTGHIGGLQPCAWYHFAVRSMDDNAQLSGFHDTALFQTFGLGCEGGGFSAHEARGEAGGAVLSSAAAPAGATVVGAATGTLVVETRRTADGAWQVSLRLANETDGLDPAAAGIAIEQENERGERQTLGRVTPDENQSLLGICSLRERGRVAIPVVYRLEQVLARLRHRAQDYTLSDAQHSRLGALGGDFVATGGSVELLDGDVVELTYSPSARVLEGLSPWYLMVGRQGTRPPTPSSQRSGLGETLPERFALHQNEPNPSGSSTMIRFDLPRETQVRLEVFDLLGRRVATLADGLYPACKHRTAWDLRDAGGGTVRPGVYVYRMSAGQFGAKRKMSVLP